MAGYVVTGSIVLGNTHHHYIQNSFDLFAQDVWTISPKLTVNFGVRYTYPGSLGASDGQVTTFIRDKGMILTDVLYPGDTTDLAPRVGLSFLPFDSRKTVVHVGYGLFYDMLPVNFFTANTSFANGGALGVGNNPGGTAPVYSITQRGFTIVNNVPVFGTAPQPPYGAFAVSEDLKLPYVESFNVNIEHHLGPSAERDHGVLKKAARSGQVEVVMEADR